jgi:hypothetical protein
MFHTMGGHWQDFRSVKHIWEFLSQLLLQLIFTPGHRRHRRSTCLSASRWSPQVPTCTAVAAGEGHSSET